MGAECYNAASRLECRKSTEVRCLQWWRLEQDLTKEIEGNCEGVLLRNSELSTNMQIKLWVKLRALEIQKENKDQELVLPLALIHSYANMIQSCSITSTCQLQPVEAHSYIYSFWNINKINHQKM